MKEELKVEECLERQITTRTKKEEQSTTTSGEQTRKKRQITGCSCGSELSVYARCVACAKPVRFTKSYNLNWMVPGLACGSLTKVNDIFASDVAELLAHQKLRLVLDLDETLIHAKKLPQDFCAAEDETIPIVWIGKHRYKIWVRPHLRKFLESIQDLYDVYIYTHSTRTYAERILNALGIRPLIRRVCARERREKRQRKRLSRMLCRRSLSLIVDDKRHVWHADDQANLVRVAPFMGCIKDQVLTTLTSMLLGIHQQFWKQPHAGADVRSMLASI